MKKAVVIGGSGFIGKHICLCLSEANVPYSVIEKNSSKTDIESAFADASFVIDAHGINRSFDLQNFYKINYDQTKLYVNLARNWHIPYLYLSSISASKNTPYGESKRLAEEYIDSLREPNIFYVRLSNVFGPECLPFSNSVVATWLYCAVNKKTEEIHLFPESENALVPFLYVSDVAEIIVDAFLSGTPLKQDDIDRLITFVPLIELYRLMGDLSKNGCDTMTLFAYSPLPSIFLKKLYATYLYAKGTYQFCSLIKHQDTRGSFAELLKGGFHDNSQFSLNTIMPYQIKGDHYHHSKVERFIFLKSGIQVMLTNVFTGAIVFKQEAPDGTYIDIPPFYNHIFTSTNNVETPMLIWSSDLYIPGEINDTYKKDLGKK